MNKLRFWNNVGFATSLSFLVGILALLVGWVMNIFAIVQTLSDPLTGLFIARLVGTVVFPLGGVLGYF